MDAGCKLCELPGVAFAIDLPVAAVCALWLRPDGYLVLGTSETTDIGMPAAAGESPWRCALRIVSTVRKARRHVGGRFRHGHCMIGGRFRHGHCMKRGTCADVEQFKRSDSVFAMLESGHGGYARRPAQR